MADSYVEIMLAVLFFFSILFFFIKLVCNYIKRKVNDQLSRNWPLIGMLPVLVLNPHRLPELLVELLEKSNGTVQINGGILCATINMLATCDPNNVRHITSTSFLNYPKWPEFPELFDTLGVSLFTLMKPEQWKRYRTILHPYFTNKQTQKFMENVISVNIKEGLVPVLDHASKQGLVVDLQDVLKRHMHDFGCRMATGYNPNTLNVDFPDSAFVKTVDYVGEVAFYRYLVPEFVWKLQRRLGIGMEKKLSASQERVRGMVMKYVSMKREMLSKKGAPEEESFDLLTCMLAKNEIFGSGTTVQDFDEETIRDNVMGFMFATQGTVTAALSWFFYLLSKNPSAEMKIREEIITSSTSSTDDQDQASNVGKLSYLHAALCETLRLYPPPPFLPRISIQSDTLPSGHRVEGKTKVLLSPYAMGRMKWLWGEDCNEFKPERWMDEKGEIKYEPLNKFFVFSAGPRICPGKNMAFKIMKSVVSAIILNYNVRILDSAHVVPAESILFLMKHGLLAKVQKQQQLSFSN